MSPICPTFVLLLAASQCTTSRCTEEFEPARGNGAVYLQSLLAATTERIMDAVDGRFAAMTSAIEVKLAKHMDSLDGRLASFKDDILNASDMRLASFKDDILSATDGRLTSFKDYILNSAEVYMDAMEERIMREAESCLERVSNNMTSVVHGAEGRLTACCSSTSMDIRQLVSCLHNSSKEAEDCTERKSSTQRDGPQTTPVTTESPLTTPVTAESPWTTPVTTESPLTTPVTTESLLTTPGTGPREVFFLWRQDGSVTFYRDWAAYKSGFGNQAGEFWLGLETLHRLTTQYVYSIRADIEDWSGETKWEEWSTFRVAGEGAGYRLTVSGYNPASTAGENLGYNSGRGFSTHDRGSSTSCAVGRQGAWWYNGCTYANPTGPYRPAGYMGHKGIYWERVYYDRRSFKGVTMRLVRV